MQFSASQKNGRFDVDEIGACLHRLFIADAATTLRKEDRQKAHELAPFLDEIARVATKKSGVFVDACAGKSALGLLAAALVLPPAWRVVVIERDPARAAHAQQAAASLGRAVDVVCSDVSTFDAGADVVVGLHACGTASDAIIDAAVAAQVRHLLLVPCCYGAHPQKTAAQTASTKAASTSDPSPGQAASTAFLDRLPRQGVVGRRFAAALIDAERTLRLEAGGYDVDVVEFVAPTITPHNLLWRARRSGEAVRMAEAAARRTRLLASV